MHGAPLKRITERVAEPTSQIMIKPAHYILTKELLYLAMYINVSNFCEILRHNLGLFSICICN